MNAVRELIGVITTVVILMVHMHVAVLLDIALTEMDTLATVQYINLINTVHRITVCSNYHVDVDECDENTDGCFQTCTNTCLLYTSPSPRDATLSRMPSSA